MAFDTAVGEGYSNPVAFAFVFNLIIGVGALSQPYGFEQAGLFLGILLLILLCFVAYMAVSWLIEVQACSNALLWKNGDPSESTAELLGDSAEAVSEATPLLNSAAASDNLDYSLAPRYKATNSSMTVQQRRSSSSSSSGSSGSSSPQQPSIERYSSSSIEFLDPPRSSLEEYDAFEKDLVVAGVQSSAPQDGELGLVTASSTPFDIVRRVEMGPMANLFCGIAWEIFFYVLLVIYLYGDLAIYAAAVPTSLQAVTGGWGPFSRDDVYYVYLALFAILVVPFCFFDFQKTKYLQLFTIITRNFALFMMIIIAFVTVGQGLGAPIVDVSVVRWKGLPSLFGVLIYSFMCHHSLPSLISPIKDKKWVSVMLAADYCVILFVYAALNYSALLAFSDKDDLACSSFYPCQIESFYTNTFVSYPIQWMGIFLALFPVFTLSTNYPLISITLRNNLAQLLSYFESEDKKGVAGHYCGCTAGDRQCMLDCGCWDQCGGGRFAWHRIKKYVYAALASFPPILVAFLVHDVSILVDFTGSYAGLGIQWVMPGVLVWYSRRRMAKELPGVKNPHESWFKHVAW
eukprot:CAMPEP_0177631576 /NCGR_PEP_ID=MMETSP0447-20121125/1824_1 /TAXON_ID=0 /ORGANISM="Stygamoeba regulata, Strain BSH-02190019" /LENGTH=572 /DNA_ID=CAMNT_0019133071 /DNA_START=138 /DNA_END=1853 /DNA_ORIENTATION=-